MSLFHIEKSGWFPWDLLTVPNWDGSTYFGITPSASSSQYESVKGAGTFFPFEADTDIGAKLYWRERAQKLTLNVEASYTFGGLENIISDTVDVLRNSNPSESTSNKLVVPDFWLFDGLVDGTRDGSPQTYICRLTLWQASDPDDVVFEEFSTYNGVQIYPSMNFYVAGSFFSSVKFSGSVQVGDMTISGTSITIPIYGAGSYSEDIEAVLSIVP